MGPQPSHVSAPSRNTKSKPLETLGQASLIQLMHHRRLPKCTRTQYHTSLLQYTIRWTYQTSSIDAVLYHTSRSELDGYSRRVCFGAWLFASPRHRRSGQLSSSNRYQLQLCTSMAMHNVRIRKTKITVFKSGLFVEHLSCG